MGSRGMVLGFNGQGQSLNGAQVERCHCLRVLLFSLKLFEVEPVGPVDDKHDRHDTEGHVPAHIAA